MPHTAPCHSTRPLRRRARSALGLTLLFIAGAHAAGWALLQGLPRLRDPMYHQRADLLADRVRKPREKPFAVVMLGSSRVQRGFAPLELEESLAGALGRPVVAFNFGVQGSGPLLHHLYLRRMLADGLRPDVLYLEVTPSMLIDAEGQPRELRSRAIDPRFLHWEELAVLEGLGAGWPEMRDEWRTARAKPLWEYRFQFVWSVLPAWVPPQYSAARGRPSDPCGWTPIVLDSFNDEMRGKALVMARREHQRVVSNPTLHPAPVAALRSTCALCRDHGMPLTLVLMPEGPSFRALYTPQAEASWRAVLKQTREEFGLAVVDTRDWVGEDGFTDGHHLLPHGARLFSARFATEVVLPRAAEWRMRSKEHAAR